MLRYCWGHGDFGLGCFRFLSQCCKTQRQALAFPGSSPVQLRIRCPFLLQSSLWDMPQPTLPPTSTLRQKLKETSFSPRSLGVLMLSLKPAEHAQEFMHLQCDRSPEFLLGVMFCVIPSCFIFSYSSEARSRVHGYLLMSLNPLCH